MTRTAAALVLDVRVQYRNNLYFMTAFVALINVVLLRGFFDVDMRSAILPPFLLLSLIICFYLAGAMVTLEKSEHTLMAVSVSPLRPAEYLLAKAGSMALIGVFEVFATAILAGVWPFNPLPLALAAVAYGAMYGLAGVALVARYRRATDWLLPAIAFTTLFELPLLHVFEVWPHALWHAWPSMPQLVLARGAFEPLAAWEWVYGIGYSAVVAAAMGGWARRSFLKHVVEEGGG